MYVKRNIEARSCNHCGRGKTMSITQPECVSKTLGIQHALRMSRIVICDLPPLYNIFLHYLTNVTIFEKVAEHEK